MSASEPRRVVIVYDTRLGHTAKVAAALEEGLNRTPGVAAVSVFAEAAKGPQVAEADLLIVGGPTERLGESQHLRTFFRRIGGYDLRGKFGFAFETHAGSWLHGGAAHGIEEGMKILGMVILRPHESAITVAGPLGTTRTVELAPGTEAHFQKVGEDLGGALLEAAAQRDHRLMDAPVADVPA